MTSVWHSTSMCPCLTSQTCHLWCDSYSEKHGTLSLYCRLAAEQARLDTHTNTYIYSNNFFYTILGITCWVTDICCWVITFTHTASQTFWVINHCIRNTNTCQYVSHCCCECRLLECRISLSKINPRYWDLLCLLDGMWAPRLGLISPCLIVWK